MGNHVSEDIFNSVQSLKVKVQSSDYTSHDIGQTMGYTNTEIERRRMKAQTTTFVERQRGSSESADFSFAGQLLGV